MVAIRLPTRCLPVLAIAAIGTGLAACQSITPAAGIASAATPAPMPRIVATSCQGCHAVRARMPSPDPRAPSFAELANKDGLSRNTLSAFLRNAHNYPEEMKMTLSPNEIEEIASYVVSLRDTAYRPIL